MGRRDCSEAMLEGAWSLLPQEEISELVGGGEDGADGARKEFDLGAEEIGPLHYAVCYGNLTTVKFLLVRLFFVSRQESLTLLPTNHLL